MSSVHAAVSATETQTVSPLLPPGAPFQQPLSPTDHDENSRDVTHPTTSSEALRRVNEAEKETEGLERGAEGGPSSDALGVAEHAERSEQEQEQGALMSNEDSGQWQEEDSHDLKRVKVYELIGSRWVDQGTAFCFGDFQDNEALLIARAEADFNHVILSTTIRSNDVYQRQQDTLIVWTEPDGVDYALSFQDPEGCAEVWHFIQEVQRHMTVREDAGLSSSPMIGPEPSITTAHIIRSGHLPHPQLGIMGEIEKAIKTLARTSTFKERLCEYILAEDYIKAMVDVMHQAEDLESLENLHALCSCMQSILLLNDHSLYEHILDDDMFLGVVGILEYDPEFPTYKANYREFLHETSRFHQPIPLRDEAIQRKIHHTYRLQFLKDVVLARAIDDSTFNVLNSSIIFNQIDIINHVQNDPAFLGEVASVFKGESSIAGLDLAMKSEEPQNEEPQKDADQMDVDKSEVKSNGFHVNGTGATSPKIVPEEEPARRREVIFLIQQLCVMGKNIQLPARLTLFRTLVERQILFAVQWALSQPETDEEGRQMIAAAGEILTALLDHDVHGVRRFVIKQVEAMDQEKASGKKVIGQETLVALLCRILVKSRDLAVQSQVGESLKALMELQGETPETHPAGVGVKMVPRPKDDPATERFLDYFYKHCIDTLLRPFGDIPEFNTLTDLPSTMSREKANLYLYLCDLLGSFLPQHSFRIHFFFLSSNVAPRIASLLSAKDKHLRLAAFRFFRACLRLNNVNLFKHLYKHDIFRSILDLTIRESRRDNLLSASCQEFFEYMRKENMKGPIEHCMTHHEVKIRELAETLLGGPRFQNFIRRYEMNMAPPPEEEQKTEKPVPNGARRWGQGRLLEAEEEDYFNADDDEEEFLPILSSPPRGNPLKRKRVRGMSLPGRVSRSQYHPMPLQPLSALVAYDDSDDLGGFGPMEDNASPSSPSIPHRTASMSSGYFPASSEVPESPRIAHKQIPSKPPPSQPADEDDLLEQLFTSGPSSPSLAGRPPDVGAKRRREDEDDELLERLASRSKRPSVGLSPEKENSDSPAAGKTSLAKPPEEGPKKIKLKFSAVGAAVASSAPTAPSNPSSKEGDNG